MKILCPIDFSKHSVPALNYAARLAEDLRAELHIIHVFRNADVVESLKELKEELSKIHLIKINSLAKNLTICFSGKIETKVLYGDPKEEILAYTRDGGIGLMVMGSKGNSTLENRILGSITVGVVDKVDIPVLVLPSDELAEYAPSKVLLALDNLELEHEYVFNIPKSLVEIWNKKIDLIHVSSKDETSFPFDPFIGYFLDEYQGEIHLIKSEDVGFRLMSFVKDNNFNLLIMVKRKKGFWARLFKKNHITEEIKRCFVPLLILPE